MAKTCVWKGGWHPCPTDTFLVLHVFVTKPLYSQAKDNIVHLDQSIQEAHKIENQLLEVSHWITSVGTEIQNRLDADVLAGDVPEESEVSGVP